MYNDILFDFPCSDTFRRYEDWQNEKETPPRQSIAQERADVMHERKMRNHHLDWHLWGRYETGTD